MARKSTPQPLTLDESINVAESFDRSPLSPKSPRSPFAKFSSSGKKLQKEREEALMQATEPQQTRSAIPSSQTAPSLSSAQVDKQERPTRSGFFSNIKAGKSSSKLPQQPQQSTDSAKLTPEDTMSRDNDRGAVAGVSSRDKPRSDSSRDRSTKRKPVAGPKSSDLSVDNTTEQPPSSSGSNGKKNKPKPFNLLNRTKSIRDEQSPTDTSPGSQPPESDHSQLSHDLPLRTAPPQSHDRPSFRDMLNTNVRQRSEDRRPAIHRDASSGRDRDNSRYQQQAPSGHGFLGNLRSTAAKGAGLVSKGLFGKGGRSYSTNEREPSVDDEHYVLKVLKLPLIEQTRLTRISKRLEESNDKTEFWMPAFPWRAIDYLNFKGTNVEGLYRVPGSAPDIKKWQRRFDQEHDVDLFKQEDLYDINTIGSMLKSWLRDLPDEIFPKDAQRRVQQQAPNAETVPEVLTEELSKLPPFNYYLLFAITCHLSLLLAHSDENKMNFNNLLICFQPCMKIDVYCFRFLVCEWRDCWKGCKNEAPYIAEEYRLIEPQPPTSAEGSTVVDSHDERNLSSSDSSKPNTANTEKVPREKNQGRRQELPLSQDQGSHATIQNTTLTVNQEHTRQPDLKRLSPIKPLSPIGL